jgi:hypothetical protein
MGSSPLSLCFHQYNISSGIMTIMYQKVSGFSLHWRLSHVSIRGYRLFTFSIDKASQKRDQDSGNIIFIRCFLSTFSGITIRVRVKMSPQKRAPGDAKIIEKSATELNYLSSLVARMCVRFS